MLSSKPGMLSLRLAGLAGESATSTISNFSRSLSHTHFGALSQQKQQRFRATVKSQMINANRHPHQYNFSSSAYCGGIRDDSDNSRPPYIDCQAQYQPKPHVAFTENRGNTEENETHGQPLHRFGSSHKLEQAANRFDVQHNEHPATHDYQPDLGSEHQVDVYNHSPSVNLSACMQSQVPEPYGKSPSYMNMPGGVNRRDDKFLQGRLSDMMGKREFCTQSLRRSTHRLDEHGNETFNKESVERILTDPCPQGIQGEDCEQFKLWLSNCLEQGGSSECERLANEYIAGRKTLAQVFAEYDIEIKKVASVSPNPTSSQVGTEHLVFSTPAGGDIPIQVPPTGSPASGPTGPKASETRVARLKAAVRDYGSTVIVFHVGISLASLGFFYTLVASNVDVLAILQYFNINIGIAQTASTFAIAYGVHKIFAPVRIGITLTCAPLIVKSLRARGILKTPPKA